MDTVLDLLGGLIIGYFILKGISIFLSSKPSKSETIRSLRTEIEDLRRLTIDQSILITKMKAASLIKSSCDFTEDELMFILKRTHPDLNSNSELANSVTKKINHLRQH